MPDIAGRRSIPSETWPPVECWITRQQVLAAECFRRLGLGPERSAVGIWSSQALKVLGPDSFAKFAAVRIPGKVIWCNFDLARQLGFKFPGTNQLTPELHEQMLATLSLRALGPTDTASAQEIVTMYADRYGGDGLGPAMGAGRAGFLPYGNLYVKGIGFTPLFKHNDPDDFAHSHGGVHLDDCLVEAVFGEVDENLFTKGSNRLVAIIDQGKEVIAPDGKRIPIGLAVRTGAQLRPAHLLRRLRTKHSQLENFVAITRASGQLVTSSGDLPDLKATMLRIIDDHARTAAEGFRWRMIHGALSASNMDISGAMLDLPTQSTQPRTAPVWLLDYSDSIFGSEHTARAVYLAPIYRKLLRNLPEAQWKMFNLELLNIRDEMAQAHRRHLQVQLLRAAGLKTEVARQIQADHAKLAGRFADLLTELSRLKNRGALCVAKTTVDQVAVVDVFNLLARIPEFYFANPAADHRAVIYDQLKPVLKGNRFHRASKQAMVRTLVDKFAELYRELMSVCGEYAPVFYGNLQNMHTSIAARAAFENAPLECLYSHRLFRELRESIATYQSNGNASILREAIDRRIVASLRSVDGLLMQGDARLIAGGIEIEMRTIDGVNYSVRCWNDEKQTRILHIGIPAELDRSHYMTTLHGLPHLTKRQIDSLRYRFTIDGWKTCAEASGQLVHDKRDGRIISFSLPAEIHTVARLEGGFYLSLGSRQSKTGRGTPPLRNQDCDSKGYVFVIPDRHELNTLVMRPGPAG